MGKDNESFEKITSAYSQVYPGFSELLDDSFRKYIKYNFDRDKTCDHEWRRVEIHKIGERFECRKCSGLLEEKDLEPETT